MKTETCPSLQALQQLLLGNLPLGERDALEEHVLNCDRCVANAETISSDDDLTRLARQATPRPDGQSDVINALIGRIKKARKEAETLRLEETVAGQLPHETPFPTPSSSSQHLDFLAPPQADGELGRLGEYRILEVLGMGGMGVVLKAEDIRLKRVVALKTMKPSIASSRDAKSRFMREAQATAALEHDHIVPIYQVGEDRGVPFIAMQFLKGESLAKRLERVKKLSTSEVVRLGKEIALGLACAHEASMVHRDIKPDNVWLDEKTDRAKILDFGLVSAASEDEGLTQFGTVLGTPKYMAPEQALAQPVDHRADLFSLGSVLYHVATGESPFAANNFTSTLIAVANQQPKSLQAAAPELHVDAANLISQLLEKNPSKRPQTASDVAQRFAAIEQDLRHLRIKGTTTDPMSETVSDASAPKLKSVVPPRKPPQRKLMLASAGGLAALLLGILVITIQDKDGKETVIRVPEGTEIDVKAAPGSKVTIRQDGSGKVSEPNMAAATKAAGSTTAKSETKAPTKFTPTKPLVEMDLTPAPPLGTWEMGPEPPWFDQEFVWNAYSLRDANVLPGILDRPTVIPGIKRWNVDTVWPRNSVIKVAYSPDSKWIGVLDAHLHLYDAKTLKLTQILPGFRPQYGANDFAWSPDSQRVAVVADTTAKVRVFGVEGRLLQEIMPQGGVSAVVWNKTGDRLAVGIRGAASNGNCIEIYDQAGTLLQSLPETAATEGEGVDFEGLAWSDDGKQLVACHLDGKARSWNVESRQSEVIDDFVAFANRPSLSWHPSGWLAITNRKEVRIYSSDLKLDHTIPADIGCVRWHPDGRRLLCSGYWVTVWDRIEKKEVLSGEGRLFSGHCSADWNPNGDEVAYTGGQKFALAVAPANLKRPRFERLTPYSYLQVTTALAWSPDGQTLAQGSLGHVQLWTRDGGANRRPSDVGGAYLDWNSDGKELFTGTDFGVGQPNVSAISLDGTVRDVYRSGNLYTLGSIADSPDGTIIIISRTDGHLQILDRAGQTIQELPTGGNTIPYIAWNHLTGLIAVAEPGQPLKFLDHHNGWTLRTVGEVPLPHFQDAPVWSPDGKMLSIVWSNLWFDNSGKSLPEQVCAEAWRPDGQQYLSNSNGAIAVCNRQAGQPTIRYPQGVLDCASAWHPRGHLFAIGTRDARFTVWHQADVQPYWHGVLLPDNKSASFSAAGELLAGNPDEIDQYLVYYIDRGDGRIETLTPAEFRQLLPPK